MTLEQRIQCIRFREEAYVLSRAAAQAELFMALGFPPIALVNAYVCPRCGLHSAHPQDVAHRYCAECHRFEADPR